MTNDLHQTYVASAANTLLFQIAMPWPGAELKDTLDYVPIDVGQPNEPGLKRTMDIWTAARGSVDDFSVLGFNPPTVRERSGGSQLSVARTANVARTSICAVAAL
jgi:hypothetical protein